MMTSQRFQGGDGCWLRGAWHSVPKLIAQKGSPRCRNGGGPLDVKLLTMASNSRLLLVTALVVLFAHAVLAGDDDDDDDEEKSASRKDR